MTVETYSPTDPQSTQGSNDVTATAAARTHILAQIARSEGNHLRLGVKESGCNGYMYTLDYIAAPSDDDLPIELGDNLTVYVAREELTLVSGTELDYVTEGLNSMLQFKNANAQSYCGCGESFSIG